MNQKINLVGMNLENLKQWIVQNNEKKFRAQQLCEWIYKKRVGNFNQITTFNQELKNKLNRIAEIKYLKTISKLKSQQDNTIKYLFELTDGERIETVLMQDGPNNTACLSSQAGCQLKCSFCLTGRMGFKRNLTVHEIVSQLLIVQNDLINPHKRLNIVFMGMGEPLLNYKNLIKAIKILIAEWGPGLGKRRITVSTAGIPDQIKLLTDEELGVKLAVSLNAPDDKLRSKIMPINNQFNLEKLSESIIYFSKKNKRDRVTFEYILIKNLNDSDTIAKKLLKFLNPFKYKLNIIPYNTSTFLDYQTPDEKKIEQFMQILAKGHGALTVRRSKGQDILAACGQLQTSQSLND